MTSTIFEDVEIALSLLLPTSPTDGFTVKKQSKELQNKRGDSNDGNTRK